MSLYLPTLSPLLDPPFHHPPTCLCPLLLFSPPPLPPSLLCFSPSVFLSAFAALLPFSSSLLLFVYLFPTRLLCLSFCPPLLLSHSSLPPPPPTPLHLLLPLLHLLHLLLPLLPSHSSLLRSSLSPLLLSCPPMLSFSSSSLTLGSCAPPPHPLLLSGFSLVSLSRPSSTPPRVLTPFPLFLHLLSSSLVSLSCSPLCAAVRCLVALISAWWMATWVHLNHRPGGLDQWANLRAHMYTTWSKLFDSQTTSTIFLATTAHSDVLVRPLQKSIQQLWEDHSFDAKCVFCHCTDYWRQIVRKSWFRRTQRKGSLAKLTYLFQNGWLPLGVMISVFRSR